MELTAVFYHYKIYLALIQTQFTKSLQKYTKLAGQQQQKKNSQKVAENAPGKKANALADSAEAAKLLSVK